MYSLLTSTPRGCYRSPMARRIPPLPSPPPVSSSSLIPTDLLGAFAPPQRSNLSALCFHNLTNLFSRLPAHIDFYFHHFHALTNCLFRKSFALINICVAPWCFSREFEPFRYSRLKTKVKSFIFILRLQLFVVAKKVIRIGINNFHALLQKHPGYARCPRTRFPEDVKSVDCRRDYPSGENRRVATAMGRPTQKMWMTTPMTIILTEKGNFTAAESGTTTRFMKKYTATP